MGKKYFYILVLFFLLGPSGLVFAESVSLLKEKPKSILGKIKENYEDLNSLSLELNYKLYKGFQSKEISQEYSSSYYKKDESFYRKIGNVELLSNQEFSLNVNHEEKLILLSSPSKIEIIDASIESSLKFCSDVKVVEKDNGLSISLIIGTKTDIPFSVIQLNVDKKYMIQDIVMFYSTELNFSDDFFTKDMAYPKLVVTYGKLKQKWKDSDGLLLTERYITIGPNKVEPSAWLSGYKVLDLRTQN